VRHFLVLPWPGVWQSPEGKIREIMASEGGPELHAPLPNANRFGRNGIADFFRSRRLPARFAPGKCLQNTLFPRFDPAGDSVSVRIPAQNASRAQFDGRFASGIDAPKISTEETHVQGFGHRVIGVTRQSKSRNQQGSFQVPYWVFDCPECSREFVHTEIPDDATSSMRDPLGWLAEKPSFPESGMRVCCPNCKKTSLYQRYQLVYRDLIPVKRL
jgi:hypothetical protein